MGEDKKRDSSFYWQLFKSTFIISAFTVGGGYVIVPLLRAKFVEERHWISDRDAQEMVSVAQAAPGIIAVNAAVILGYRMAGITGALVTMLATILPPLITLTIISYCYSWFASDPFVRTLLKGMQCGATALILAVMYDWLRKALKKKLFLVTLIIVVVFAANYVFHLNMLYLILLAGLIGFVGMRDKKYE